MPALVLWGGLDSLAPVAVGWALADGLADARFHALDNCGHLPTLERPRECAVRMRELLDRWDGQAARFSDQK